MWEQSPLAGYGQALDAFSGGRAQSTLLIAGGCFALVLIQYVLERYKRWRQDRLDKSVTRV